MDNSMKSLSNEQPPSEELSRRKLVSFLGAVVGGTTLTGCVTESPSPDRSPTGTKPQPLVTIEGGADATNHADLDAALRASVTSGPITLVIDKPVEVSETSMEIPAHVTLRFQDAGCLVVPPGKTVVLSGPIEAPAGPGHALFKVGGFALPDGGVGGGSAVPNHAGTRYYANWWSDNLGKAGADGEPNPGDIGQQWNNMMRDVVKSGSGVTARNFAVAGARVLSTMMDVRDFQAAQHFDFSGSVIRVVMPGGGVAVNFTNSWGLRVTRLSLRSLENVTSGSGPHVGVLLARAMIGPDPGSHDGSMTFEDPQIIGVWRVAALYNVDSRNNVFIGGAIENLGPSTAVGSYAAFFCRHLVDTIFPAPGPGGLLPLSAPVTGAGSGQVLLATRLRGNVTKATLGIRGFDAVSARSIFTYGIGSGQSHVEIDFSDNSGMGGVQIDNVCGEGTARYGLKIVSSVDGNRLSNITFSTRKLEVTERSVYIDAKFVDAATFRVRGSGKPFECVSKVWLRDATIEIPDVPGQTDPLLILGKTFTGRIMIGDIALINAVATTGFYDAEITSVEGGTARTRYHVPLSIKARAPVGVQGVPVPAPGEAILWLEKTTGNIKVSIGTGGTPVVKCLALWTDDPDPVPGCSP